EFTTVFIFGVYIPPSANAKEALCEHVDFAMRGTNTLDLGYTNIPSAYRAEPRPHLGYSDHISVMLIPAYRPLIRCSKPVLKQVKTWPTGSISTLQDCFECTDWNMFREAATNGNSINLEEYTTSVTSYIGKCIDDVTVSKTITTRSNQKLWMTAEVRALLKSRDSAFRAGDKTALKTVRDKLVNPQKSAGPDNIPGRVLRECAEQLADVLTNIFNISLSSAIVSTCLKTTTTFHVPKKSTASCLNDYRPIALTPIIMKWFERLVMRHIKTQLLPSLDPLQFAYRPNRSTDDAITTTLHLSLTHLYCPSHNKDTYVRMLFIDFSSAFNTIIPQHLIEKLSFLGINTSLCNWILDFLTGRPHPLLFTLLTHDCAAMHNSNYIVKFADDTTVVGLINKNSKSAYREEVQWLTAWCKANNLSLNVEKPKEMVVDFRRAQSDHSPLDIDWSNMEIIKSTKFLCVHLVEDLTWSLNTSSITKKAQQCLYFLQRQRKAHIPPLILTTFYRGTIESVLSSCITVWFGNCTVSDRKTLQRIVRTAEKIIVVSLPSITDIYSTRCIRKANSIVDDPTHPLHTLHPPAVWKE
ncbi:hypothetical protein QTP86_031012, partial [Hemibagrus guttatus]